MGLFSSRIECDNPICQWVQNLEYGLMAESTVQQVNSLFQTFADRSSQIAKGFSNTLEEGVKNFDFKNIGELYGQGIWDFGLEINDGIIKTMKNFSWRFLVNIGPYTIGIPLAVLVSRLTVKYFYEFFKFNLGRPKLAIESHRVSSLPRFLRDAAKKITSVFFKSTPVHALFNPNLMKKISHITEGVKNIRNNNGFFQNTLLYGPPGTGKTMISKEIARNADMNYIFMSGGDLPQYVKRGEHVTELNKLIDTAERSSNPTIIFIDEAESLCRDRSVLSQELLELQNALLNRTSTQSKKIMFVLATNRKDDLDSAILSRMDYKIHIGLPALKERVGILQMYAQEMFNKEEIGKFFTIDNCRKIALKTHGFTGRRLFKVLNTIFTRKFATKENKLSQKLIDEVIAEFVEQERQSQKLSAYMRVNNLFQDIHAQIMSLMIALKLSFTGLLSSRSIKKA